MAIASNIHAGVIALLKRHPGKASLRTKRYQATLDVAFLEEILKQES